MCAREREREREGNPLTGPGAATFDYYIDIVSTPGKFALGLVGFDILLIS